MARVIKVRCSRSESKDGGTQGKARMLGHSGITPCATVWAAGSQPQPSAALSVPILTPSSSLEEEASLSLACAAEPPVFRSVTPDLHSVPCPLQPSPHACTRTLNIPMQMFHSNLKLTEPLHEIPWPLVSYFREDSHHPPGTLLGLLDPLPPFPWPTKFHTFPPHP